MVAVVRCCQVIHNGDMMVAVAFWRFAFDSLFRTVRLYSLGCVLAR